MWRWIPLAGLLLGCAATPDLGERRASWCPDGAAPKVEDFASSSVALSCENDSGVGVGTTLVWDKDDAHPLILVDFDERGRMHGRWLTWYANGRLLSESQYVQGSVEGEMRMWHENGSLGVRAQYSDSELEGSWVQWRPDNSLLLHRTYHLGEAHGPYVIWHENGAVKTVGSYLNGEKAGVWQSWTEDGARTPAAAESAGPAAPQ